MRILGLLTAAAVFSAAWTPSHSEETRPNPLEPSATWDAIQFDVVGDVELRDGTDLYTLEAPFRAMDAALVPIRFTQMDGAPDVRRLLLVVDENPAPIAAEFSFGAAMQPVDLETRVRVDAYTDIRAIIETTDGEHYMAGRFVRAAGGCSAPAAKDAAEALASLGQMKVRWFDGGDADGRRDVQVMLRHPNYSGLQRDPLTLLSIPAHFVDNLEVRQGDELLFTMAAGISISEDPTFRFKYSDRASGNIDVRATDTDGGTFERSFPAGS